MKTSDFVFIGIKGLVVALIDEDAVKPVAIDDTDLKLLWASMGGTLWKRCE